MPTVNQTIEYRDVNAAGIEQPFWIFSGSPLEKVSLQEFSASITRIEKYIEDDEISHYMETNDEIREKVSFKYNIKWDDTELVGEIYMISASHSETDFLLD